MPAKNAPSILLFEDDLSLRRKVREELERLGYDVHETCSISDTIGKVISGVYELVVLDLPVRSKTIMLIKRLRSISTVPIIIISDRSDVAEKIDMLERGADDLIVKPFCIRELLARTKAILRRMGRTRVESRVIEIGDLTIDVASRQVRKGDLSLNLSAKEGRLLSVLAVQAGRVVSQQVLIGHVWGERHLDERDYLRVLVRKIRKKIEPDPEKPSILLNERGVGYKLASPAAPAKGRRRP